LNAGINIGGHYFTTAIVKIPEGVVKGFKSLHGLLTNINKNSGKQIKFGQILTPNKIRRPPLDPKNACQKKKKIGNMICIEAMAEKLSKIMFCYFDAECSF
jgi:hypothetical protein